MPRLPTLGHGTNQKSANYTLKLHNQILIKLTCGRGLRYWHFSIILISLKVEAAQFSDFLLQAKILSLWKAFFILNLPHSTLDKKDIALIFLHIITHGLFWSSSISTNCWGTLSFECFLANAIKFSVFNENNERVAFIGIVIHNDFVLPMSLFFGLTLR